MMKLPAFEISTLKAPNWLFVLSMFGFLRSNSIDLKHFGFGIVVILWSYQGFFEKEDTFTKWLKYIMRTMALTVIVVSVLQPSS